MNYPKTNLPLSEGRSAVGENPATRSGLLARIARARGDSIPSVVGCAAYAAAECSGTTSEYVVTFQDGQQRRVMACDACRDWFAQSFRVERAAFVPEWRLRLRAVDHTSEIRGAA